MINQTVIKSTKSKNYLQFFLTLIIVGAIFLGGDALAAPVISIISSPAPKSNNLPTVVASSTADVGRTIVSATSQIYPSDQSPSGTKSACIASGGYAFGSNHLEFTCTVSSLADGNYKMNIEVIDNLGGIKSVETSSFIVDRTGPIVTFNSLVNAPNPINFNNPTFTGTITDSLTNVTGVEYKWRLTSTTDTTPVDFGNSGWTACDSIAVASTTVSFTCNPAHNFPDNIKGDEYRMHVRGVDEVSNISSFTNFYKFQVDTIAPISLAILTPSASGITINGNHGYNITWTPPTDAFELGSNPIKIEYSALGNFSDTQLITNNYIPSGPYYWTAPSQGTVTARIRITATDLAKNSMVSVSANPFTVIAYSAPQVSISAIANNATNSLPLTITANAYDPQNIASAYYQIDSGSWTACSATDSSFGDTTEGLTCGPFSGLSEGTHTIYVSANDDSGDTGYDSYSFIYDASGPTVDAGYLSTINLATAPGATASDYYTSIVSYTWTQDSGPGTIIFSNSATLNPSISANANGTYTARLTVCDLVGNCSYDTVAFTWTDQPLGFSITAPAGGEILADGVNFDIEWLSAGGGTLDHFDLEYSVNSGGSWATILTGIAPSTLMYSWTIPVENSQTTLVRVNAKDASNALLVSATSNLFTIDSTHPTVDAGTLNSISVPTAPGASASDNFDNAGQLVYAWTQISGPGVITFSSDANILNPTISGTVSGAYVARLTVTDRAGNTSSDTVNFTWLGDPASFTVLAPSTGSFLRGTSVTPITWSVAAGAVSYKLEYTIDNGGSFTTINASTLGTATSSGLYYDWTLPSADSDESFVRVTAIDSFSNTTASYSGVFTIDSTPPIVEAGSFSVAISMPTGSTGVSASDSSSGIATYLWTKVSGPGVVIFGGGNNILSPLFSADTSGSYTVRLTVTDVVGNAASDEVSFWYSVDPGSPLITSPAINVFWKGGVSRNVEWTMVSDPGNLSGFMVDYSLNNGGSWTNIGGLLASTSRLVNWNLPAANSTSSLMRVVAINIAGNRATSTNPFTIDSTPPVIVIGSVGTTTIPTTSGTTATDNIDGASDLTYLWSSASTPSGGTLNFSATNIIDPVMSGTVSGYYTANLSVIDRSGYISSASLTFYWQAQPGNPIISNPSTGVFARGGTTQNINWTMNDILDLDYFALSYSIDDGASWTPIATTTAISRTYSWSVPMANSTDSLIKIEAFDSNSNQSVGTSSKFTIDSIAPTISIGSLGTISVPTVSGTSASDNIDSPSYLTYSWVETAKPVGGSLSFSSTSIVNPVMSGTVSGIYTAELTVTDRAGHISTDTISFTWQGEPGVIIISNPNNTTFVKGGATQNINWTIPTEADLDYFALSYSLNNGTSWTSIATTTPTSRIYNWSVPAATNSTNSLIKIEAFDIYSNQSVGVSSNFTIDSLAPVISIARGTNWSTTVATTSKTTVTDNIDSASELTYSWGVANTPVGGTLVFTPSTSVMDPVMSGTVSGYYTAQLTVIDRAGHTSYSSTVFYWQAEPGTPIVSNPTDSTFVHGGDTQRVDWYIDHVIDLDHFDMSYSLDNGTNWNLVTSAIASTSRTYNWSVPVGLNSDTSLVRIAAYDIYNNNASSTSALFTIDSNSPVITIGSIGTTSVATTSGTTVLDNIDGTGDLSYSWITINTPTLGTLNFSATNIMDPVMSGTVSGSYTAQLTVTDRTGNSSNSLLTFIWQGEPAIPVVYNPDSAVFVKGGGTQVINWSIPATSDLDHFNISYSLDGGLIWTVATSSVAATSRTYNWLVPAATNSTSSLIKIEAFDIYNNFSVGTSSSFTIDSTSPVITISAIGSITVATKSNTSAADNIDSASDLTYTWTMATAPAGGSLVFTPSSSILDPFMAGTITGNYSAQLVVTDRAGNTSNSYLTFYWEAAPGTPIITSPTSANYIKGGTIQNIDWFINAIDLDYFDISYSFNNGTSWSLATSSLASTSRTYSWLVPAGTNSTSSLIKIDAYNKLSVKSSGTSALFTIDSTPPVISIGSLGRINTATNPGTTVTDNIDSVGNLNYLWSSSVVPSGGVINFSSSSDIANPLISATVSGSYTTNLSVVDRAGNISANSLSFYWDGNPGTLVVTNPTNTLSAGGGTTQTISWSIPAESDLNHFNLYYSLDNGLTANIIASDLGPAIRTYSWSVPTGLNSTSSLIRVVAYDDYDNQSIGDSANFTIDSTPPVVSAGTISLPISAATSSVGVTATDNFNDLSDLTFLWTELSTPNISSHLTITNPTSANALFSGDMTGVYSSLLTVTDKSGNIGTSSLTFTWGSQGDPVITNPSINSSLKGGSTTTVAWTLTDPGNLDYIEAEYSIDNGTTWNIIDAALASSSLSTIWTVPTATNSTSSLVRISTINTGGFAAIGTSSLFTIDSTPPVVSAGSLSTIAVATAPGATATDNFSTSTQLTYTWTAVSGAVSFSNTTILNPTIWASANGVYTALLTVNDLVGNSATSSVTFTRYVAPPVTPGGGGGGGGGGSITPTPTSCTAVVYGAWSICANSIQTRSVTSQTPNSCVLTAPQIAEQTQTCDLGSNVCTEVAYGNWGTCVNGFQTRDIIFYAPFACSISSEQISAKTQTCVGISNVGGFDTDTNAILDTARQYFTKTDQKMVNRLSGQIVIAVENRGRAWYINPVDGRKYYLGSATNAYSVMRLLGIGVSNKDLNKIHVGFLDEVTKAISVEGDTLSVRLENALGKNWEATLNKNKVDPALIAKLSGRMMIQVETNGEAWYLEPRSKKRYYLGRPTEAYAIMRAFGVGITNADLNKIPVGQFTAAQLKKIDEALKK